MGCSGSKPGVAPNMGVVPDSGSKKHIPEVMSLDGPVTPPPSAPYKQKPNTVPDTPVSALPPHRSAVTNGRPFEELATTGSSGCV